ncbi:MAG: uncharacterized protein QOH72_3061 [Solirubrobacteraceae bacterium]|jgi:uncharacterized protein Yka (UPF0111/DUF47 family)|nr:uncharacterized protein [Solirubrobacteraceae bacterium]
MALLHTSEDVGVLELFEHSGRTVRRATLLLRDLLADWPERPELATDLVDCEHEGDRIAHDIIHRLHDGRASRKAIDSFDGLQLATALDDIVDNAEQTADMLGLYRVEASMEHACLLAEVLVAAGEQVSRALRVLRTGDELGPHLVEIHRLENEADRLSRDAIASLFVAGIDPMVVIRWKDIFESLEAAVDACEHVAHVLEGIAMKRRR